MPDGVMDQFDLYQPLCWQLGFSFLVICSPLNGFPTKPVHYRAGTFRKLESVFSFRGSTLLGLTTIFISLPLNGRPEDRVYFIAQARIRKSETSNLSFSASATSVWKVHILLDNLATSQNPLPGTYPRIPSSTPWDRPLGRRQPFTEALSLPV
jgi:hypothetical protein